MTLKGKRLHSHCGRGHELTSENLYVDPKGRRQCRQCKLEANRAWRHGHRHNVPFTHCRRGHLLTPETTHPLRNGSRACSICQSERQKKQYVIKGMRFSRHGINSAIYNLMLEKQYHQCPVCLLPLNGNGVIDHNHINGQVRGILCVNCNTAIGKFGDSTELLLRALRYMENGNSRT